MVIKRTIQRGEKKGMKMNDIEIVKKHHDNRVKLELLLQIKDKWTKEWKEEYQNKFVEKMANYFTNLEEKLSKEDKRRD